MREAAKRTLAQIADGSADTLEQQIYWTRVALRGHSNIHSRPVAQALRVYPALQSFVIGDSLDYHRAHSHISQLTTQAAQAEIDSTHHESATNPNVARRTNALSAWVALWSSKRRRYTSLSIIAPDGHLSADMHEAAQLLYNHWSPSFKEKPTNLDIANRALAQYVQVVPSYGIQWIVPYEDFISWLFSRKDCGCGPDGMPYSSWIHAPDVIHREIYNMYIALQNSHIPEACFLDSLLLFPPKGKDSNDFNGCAARAPKKTRPLNLSDCPNKGVSALAAFSLSQVAKITIHSSQHGVSGRVMSDHVLDLESKAIGFMLRRCPDSGIVALDQAAAFPTLSRRFLFWVLRLMKVPRNFRKLIKRLLAPSHGTISIKGCSLLRILMSGGVKQGCPAAMVLFTLAFDPIIRWICSVLSPFDCFVGAYCDDIGIVTNNLISTWTLLSKLFKLVTKFASLQLNLDKTQIMIIVHANKQIISDALVSISPELAHSVVDAVKYLGVFVGPGAQAMQWTLASENFLDAVRFLLSLDCGLTATISLFNILALPRLAWLASFINPPCHIRKLVSDSILRLTRGPWNAIPVRCATALKEIGFKNQFCDTVVQSFASRARNACSTISNYHATSIALQASLICNDRNLEPQDTDWLRHSVFQNLSDAIDHCRSSGIPISTDGTQDGIVYQSKVHKLLLHANHSRLEFCRSTFQRRLSRFFEVGTFEHCIDHIFAMYRLLGSKYKQCIIVSHLRAVCNQWCTNRRFGLVARHCLFCSAHSDSLEHYLVCARFASHFCSAINHDFFLPTTENLLCLTHLGNDLNTKAAAFCCIYLHTAFRCYNSCRHGKKMSLRLIRFQLKQIASNCQQCRKDIVFWRTHPLPPLT
jgi:hypothetical protein